MKEEFFFPIRFTFVGIQPYPFFLTSTFSSKVSAHDVDYVLHPAIVWFVLGIEWISKWKIKPNYTAHKMHIAFECEMELREVCFIYDWVAIHDLNETPE